MNHATDAFNYLVIKDSDNNLSISIDNKEFIYNSVSANTRKGYRADFNLFREWCEARSLQWMPAFPEFISEYLTQEAIRGIKPATLVRRIAAIRMAHKAFKCPNPTEHDIVKTTMQGIRRAKSTAQNKKAPLTAERLESILSHCEDSLIGLRDKALLLVGFAGAFRRSELVSLTLKDIERTPEGIKITIRKSKTDQEGKGHTIAILNGVRFRIVDTLYMWLKKAGITEGFLFRRIRKGSSVQASSLTTHTVATIIKHYASKAGLTVENFSGHSLRAGFITSVAQAGADLIKIMEVSRHKKIDTVMGYVRESKLFENHAGEKVL